MGNYLPIRLPFQSQNNGDVEEFNQSDAIYQFPPIKSGSYFADHFFMAGEKFDNTSQQTFLFGEDNDLNYLPPKPATFPYPMANHEEPSRTIRCFVHLRKDTLKLIKEDVASSEDTDIYGIEFVFDTDLDCSIQIFMMAREEFTDGNLTYSARNKALTSEPVLFGKGANQTYRNNSFLIKPTDFTPSELNFIPGGSSNTTEIPLVIMLSVVDPDFPGHSESTLAGIEALSNGLYTMKFLKQKIAVDGICLMTQEIYGIENKNNTENAHQLESWSLNDLQRQTQNRCLPFYHTYFNKPAVVYCRFVKDDDDGTFDDDDDNSECVVCMGDLRDTIMLPCRHLCLCNNCAEQMRTKQSRCPICRANFHALLQIKAVRKKEGVGSTDATSPNGLEEIPLIQALNGVLDTEGLESTAGLKRSESSHSRRSRRSSAKRKGSGKSRGSTTPRTRSTQSVQDKSDEKKKTYDHPVENSVDKKEFHSIVIDESALENSEEQKPNDHVNASLPGTPMGSDSSAESVSVSMLLSSGGSQMISTRAQVTTPSSVKLKNRPATAKAKRSSVEKKKQPVRSSSSLGFEERSGEPETESFERPSTARTQITVESSLPFEENPTAITLSDDGHDDNDDDERPPVDPNKRPPTPTGFRSEPDEYPMTDRSVRSPAAADGKEQQCFPVETNFVSEDIMVNNGRRTPSTTHPKDLPEDRV